MIIPGDDDVGEGDEVPFGDNSAGSIDAGVQEVDHDSHTSVLVFEADLVNHQGVVGLAAVCLEAGEGKGVAEHVDCLELGKREILVVILVGSIVIGVKRIKVDDSSR